MSRILYDLAGNDPELRYSSHCWRIRFALAHKQLPFETKPWYLTDDGARNLTGRGLAVLIDGDKRLEDSLAIATYLEATYPEGPSLFPSGGFSEARFIQAWWNTTPNPMLTRMIAADIVKILRPQDQAFFRDSREKAFGQTLEQAAAERDRIVVAFRQSLQPLRVVLGEQAWLSGAGPGYIDHMIGGSLMWARCVSRFELLAPDDAIALWFARLRNLYDQLGEKAVRA